VFQGLDAGVERRLGIGGEDGDLSAHDDRAGVGLGGDEVNRGAGQGDAGGQSVVDGVSAAECGLLAPTGHDGGSVAAGKEGGVDVDNAAREVAEEVRRENEHPAGEDDEVGIEEIEEGEKALLEALALGGVPAALEREINGWDAGGKPALEASTIRVVTDDEGHFGR
jgi:hypothetical protein